MHQDVSRTLTDEVYGSLFSRGYQLITLHLSPWEVLTTGYLDAWMAIAIKRGKVQLTSQIQCRCQNGQTQQKSSTTLTLTLRNGETVTHHFSYDRLVEMGSARFSASY